MVALAKFAVHSCYFRDTTARFSGRSGPEDIMKLAKTAPSYKSDPNDPLSAIDTDLTNLFLLSQGRVRFGDGSDGARGENISGEFQVYTSNGSADTEDAITHGLGAVPVGYIVVKQDAASSVYDSGTAWTSTTIYLKQSGTGVATTLFLLK